MNLNLLRWNMMNIELVKWKTEDYQDFFILSKDKKIWANMSDDFPHTLEECKQIVSFFSTSEDVTECIRAIKVDNRKVGCIAAFFETGMYCKNAEISYWLNGEYRGMGIMPQVIKHSRRNYLLNLINIEFGQDLLNLMRRLKGHWKNRDLFMKVY